MKSTKQLKNEKAIEILKDLRVFYADSLEHAEKPEEVKGAQESLQAISHAIRTLGALEYKDITWDEASGLFSNEKTVKVKKTERKSWILFVAIVLDVLLFTAALLLGLTFLHYLTHH